MKEHKIEILSPAGNFDSLVAAAKAGADGVYLGCKQFSARSAAENFDGEELQKAVEYCKSHNMAVYVALNTLYFDREKEMLIETIKEGALAGVTGFIIQDFGIFHLLSTACPTVEIHGSTQMAVHSLQGALFLKELGFHRVVLARECSLDQMKKITEESGIEIEVFVHGAQCMSISGNCYSSSMIGTRSGNRGRCAQTCRLPFQAQTQGAAKENLKKLSAKNKSLPHDLSLKDMSVIDYGKELEDMGIASLKIEGRMKGPEYVTATTHALYEVLEGRTYDKSLLEGVFSRTGFTSGYLLDHKDSMFGVRREIDTRRSKEAEKQISTLYKNTVKRIALSFTFTLDVNKGASLSTTYLKETFTAKEPVVELALEKPTTVESVNALLIKTGGTIFEIIETNITVDGVAILPAGKINQMRRDILGQITKTLTVVTPHPFDYKPRVHVERKKSPFSLVGRFSSLQQVTPLALNLLEEIILPIHQLRNLSIAPDKLRGELPYTMFQREEKVEAEIKTLMEQGITHFVANNIAHLPILKKLGASFSISSRMNCLNSDSVNFFAEQGAKKIDLSMEIHLPAAKEIKGDVPIGITIYGYPPLMTYRVCPIKDKIGCKSCNKQGKMVDEDGREFFVTCDEEASYLHNTVPIYLPDKQKDFQSMDYGLLYFTKESIKEVDKILKDYADQEKRMESNTYTRGVLYRKMQ